MAIHFSIFLGYDYTIQMTTSDPGNWNSEFGFQISLVIHLVISCGHKKKKNICAIAKSSMDHFP